MGQAPCGAQRSRLAGCARRYLAPATSLSSTADTISFSVPLCPQRREYNMNAKLFAVLLAGTNVCIASVARAHDDEDGRFPGKPRFTTRAITPFAIEGLTGDRAGNLYSTGRQTDTTKKCPIWRFARDGSRVTVAFIPNPTGCNPSGITFDADGNLYVADGAGSGTEWKVAPDAKGCDSDDSTAPACASIPTATAFATGVPGPTGTAFHPDGNLWTGDGTTGVGRVWRIAPAGGVCEPSFSGCDEVFRIQAMANVRDPAASGGVANVGRDNRSLPPGTINVARTATNTAGAHPPAPDGGGSPP